MTELFTTLQNSSDEELLPCPFCDCKDIQTYEPTIYEPGEESEVECQNPLCGATVRGITLKMAIAKWNRRGGNDISLVL